MSNVVRRQFVLYVVAWGMIYYDVTYFSNAPGLGPVIGVFICHHLLPAVTLLCTFAPTLGWGYIPPDITPRSTTQPQRFFHLCEPPSYLFCLCPVCINLRLHTSDLLFLILWCLKCWAFPKLPVPGRNCFSRRLGISNLMFRRTYKLFARCWTRVFRFLPVPPPN